MSITDYQITTTTTDGEPKRSVVVISASLFDGTIAWCLNDSIRAMGTNHVEWSIRPIFEDETPTTHSGQGEGD